IHPRSRASAVSRRRWPSCHGRPDPPGFRAARGHRRARSGTVPPRPARAAVGRGEPRARRDCDRGPAAPSPRGRDGRGTIGRDAAYEGLPYRRRRALHERVGETIEATAGESVEEEVATLAVHFHEAQRWDKAWVYASQAGDRARRVYANADAANFYSKAVSAG